MKRRYRQFLRIGSIALFIILLGNSGYSCGPDLGFDATMFLLFQREVPGDEALLPFCYAEQYLYDYNPDPMKTDQHRNCAEWRAFTNNSATEKDIYNIQYNVTPDQYLYCYNTGKWGSLEDNTFIQWLLRKENKAAAQYFAFARKVEFDGACEDDPWSGNSSSWDYPQIGVNFVAYDSLAEVGIAACKKNTGFLQQRYAFQTVKLIYYGRAYLHATSATDPASTDGLLHCYNTYLNDKPTVVADWGLLYYANSQADKMQHIYYMVKAFDKSNEKKVFVYLDLHKADLAALKQTTTDKHMRATIAAIEGMKNPGKALASIKEVYKYDPDSKYIPILLSREVNKLEDWIWSKEMKGFESQVLVATDAQAYKTKNAQKDAAYLDELRQFMISTVQTRHANNDFVKLGIVHLYHLQRNFAAALPYIKDISIANNNVYTTQLDIEKALSIIYSADVTQSGTKQQLHEVFKHLESGGTLADAGHDGTPDVISDGPTQTKMLRELYLLLSNEYKKKGDITTAALLFQKSNLVMNEYFGYGNECSNVDTMGQPYDNAGYYFRIAYLEKFGSPGDIDALLAFKHKKSHTAFEKRLVPCRWPSDDVYMDVKGTLLLRQERYKEALAVFNKVRSDFWATTYEYKYHLRKGSITSVGTLLPTANGTGKRYEMESKRDMVQEIVTVQDSLAKEKVDSVKADLCFMLGNCFYNLTYCGKDWMAYNYGKTSGEREGEQSFCNFSFRAGSQQQYKNYYRCAAAIAMYNQAYKYAHNNNELGALCLLMLSRCDRDAHNYSLYFMRNPDWSKPYYSPYIGILARHFNHTDMFERSSSECPDVEEYMLKFKKS